MGYVPLHVHSQYSVLEASSSIESLVKKAQEFSLDALALTDSGNMYGAVEFCKACAEASIKPIVGCELMLAPQSRFEKKKLAGLPPGVPLVLLAKNHKGYQNLCTLSSLAHLEGFYWTPRIDKELLRAHAEGLICLSGGTLSQWIVEGNEGQLVEEIEWFTSTFKEDYYLELQRHSMSGEQMRLDEMDQEGWLAQHHLQAMQKQALVNQRLVEIGRDRGIPLVATHASLYAEREDWRAHEILINIQSGEPCEIWEKDSQGNLKVRVKNPKRRVTDSHELYFKSPHEMSALFQDLPEAIATSAQIAAKCQFAFDFKTKYYPVFVPPHLEGKVFTPEERVQEAQQFLRALCIEGIGVRYTPEKLAEVRKQYPQKEPLDVIAERLDYELSVILPKGMGDYLLIVWDFIHWAKQQGIPMGPGRGSGAGSIVLYLIGVTDIEPLRFNLFFERFINPQRLSYPDIDVDICMERRDEVIEYTVRKYGKDKVAQIITFGTMKAKMAIKDVGRVLSIPLARVNQIAKLIPEDPTMTLTHALEIDPELRGLYERDAEIKLLIDLAKKLEGSVRNTGIHAAGLIISGDPLIERCPVCNAKDSPIVVTQYSMKPVESIGLLKIDFLGLKTLTSIQLAVHQIKLRWGKQIDWVNLPLDDKPTFDLLNQGKTIGVFQLESGGMQDLAKQLHIDVFEEIIAVVSLYRPGPMEMIPAFIQRKHKKESVDIDHPLMEKILAETYGIMVYQEQVMAIASQLAGYTLGEGDVLRRAMGKKDREEMAGQRKKFRLGALARNIPEAVASAVFDKMEKFASYGFNKSHAAAYGYLGYVTAYLKANYTREWMAALMSSDRDDLSKVARHMHEARTFDIPILPPDINESTQTFMATTQGIRFAMSGIKGIGEGVVEVILKERESRGPYTSLYDFVSRLDTRKVGKKSIEHLIEAGCFDFTTWDRQALLLVLAPLYEEIVREQKEEARGILSLFSLLKGEKGARFKIPPPILEQIPRQRLLRREHELLGIYLNGHPLDEFRPQLQRLSCVPLHELSSLPSGSTCRVAFIIEGAVIKIASKSQRKFAILTIGDGSEQYELPIWPDLYEHKAALMVENQLIYAIVQTEMQEGQIKLQCRWLENLDGVNETTIRACDLAYDQAKLQAKKMDGRNKMEKPTKSSVQKLKIQLDADATRLSHIVALKEAFRSASGAIPVEVSLTSKHHQGHSLLIDKRWGVEQSRELESKLLKIKPLRSHSWE